jgi:MSHA biogenesis protein MshJ
MSRASWSLFSWYDERPKRERIVLLVCAVIVLVFLLNLLVLEPCSRQRKRALSEVTQLQVSLADLMVRSAEVEARRANDPDKANRARVVALEQKIAKLNQKLQTNIVTLVPPQEMSGFLKELLMQRKKLQLIALENLPPEELTFGNNDNEETIQPKLYRHRLSLEFSGDYLTFLEYLKQLEALPRSLVWEEVDVETETYPQARVRLQVYTLSLTEGWIGG